MGRVFTKYFFRGDVQFKEIIENPINHETSGWDVVWIEDIRIIYIVQIRSL